MPQKTTKTPRDFCEERRKNKKTKAQRLENWAKVIGGIIDFEDDFLMLTEIDMLKNIDDLTMEELIEKKEYYARQRDFYRKRILELLKPLLAFDMQVQKPAQNYQNWYHLVSEEIKERNAGYS